MTVTNEEINDRAVTVANMAALASKVEDAAAKLMIMQVAAHLANTLTAPAYTLDKRTGEIVPFTGGKS